MTMTSGARELEAASLRRTHPPAAFGFNSTDEVPPLEGPVGQNPAAEAIAFGLETRMSGYNIFATGPVGVGKRTALVRAGQLSRLECPHRGGGDRAAHRDAGRRTRLGRTLPDGTLHARVEERLDRWARMAEEQSSVSG